MLFDVRIEVLPSSLSPAVLLRCRSCWRWSVSSEVLEVALVELVESEKEVAVEVVALLEEAKLVRLLEGTTA